MKHLLAAAALTALATATAAADSKTADVNKMATDDCARARAQKRDCVLTIESEQVDGKSPTAGGATVTAVKLDKSPSLIRLRRDFIREILRTAEDL